jgi:hypothetical protein
MSLSYNDGDGTYRLGGDRRVKASELKAGESIVVVNGNSSLYTVYRPPRRKNESPIQYYKRTGCVDNRYYFRHQGRYYCNPAHCRQTWTNKKKRDEHLDMAYAILG